MHRCIAWIECGACALLINSVVGCDERPAHDKPAAPEVRATQPPASDAKRVGRGRDRTTAVSRRAINPDLTSTCGALFRSQQVQVLCPTWLPGSDTAGDRSGYAVSQPDFEGGRCEYLTQLGYRGPEAGKRIPYHVLVGGRCQPFVLASRDGRWPRPTGQLRSSRSYSRYLRLINVVSEPGGPARIVRPRRVSRTMVNGTPALILWLATHPQGGIHGGHYAIVWNEGQNGYVLSMHLFRGDSDFEAYGGPLPPRVGDVRALKRAAQSMARIETP
jgi:hypothetical protein